MRVFVSFDQLDDRLEEMREQRREAEDVGRGLRRGRYEWLAADPLVDAAALGRAANAAERMERGIARRIEFCERISEDLGYAYRDLGRMLDDSIHELAWRRGSGD